MGVKVYLEIPSKLEMDKMSLEELNYWKEKIKPYYLRRFEIREWEESKKAYKYLWFSQMIENIENGLDRWLRIAKKPIEKG